MPVNISLGNGECMLKIAGQGEPKIAQTLSGVHSEIICPYGDYRYGATTKKASIHTYQLSMNSYLYHLKRTL